MTSEIIKTANLSEADGGIYRYRLARIWDHTNHRRVVFVCLNPSTADSEIDDPSVRKMMGFARQWNQQIKRFNGGISGQTIRDEPQPFGGIVVVNLFAYRATDPKELLTAADPIGPDNDDYIRREVFAAHQAGSIVVCAWGANRAAELTDQNYSCGPRAFNCTKLVPRYVVIAMLLNKHAPGRCFRIGPPTKDGHPRHPLYLPYSSTLEPL